MAGPKSDSGRLAVIWLATSIVLVLGAVGSVFVVIALAENKNASLTIWGCCFGFVVIGLLVLNLRWEEPMNRLKFWLSYQERSNSEDEWIAAPRRIRSREKFGTNEPPSIESVRDSAEHSSAWVPHSAPDRQRPKKS